jgi:hypothetical protein
MASFLASPGRIVFSLARTNPTASQERQRLGNVIALGSVESEGLIFSLARSNPQRRQFDQRPPRLSMIKAPFGRRPN